MKNKFIASILSSIVLGCAQSPIQLTERQIQDGLTDDKILKNIESIKVGMKINEAASYLVPDSISCPAWKDMGDGIIRYYFAVGGNKQITIDIENPDNLLPQSPIMPNGNVIRIGKLEDREKWELKWSDSNELK